MATPVVGRAKSSILSSVISFYLQSRDFNGLCVTEKLSETQKKVIAKLVRDGLVQVVSEEDGPNPHIRPWQSRRSLDAQVKDVQSVGTQGFWGVCLYPTPKAMRASLTPDQLQSEPYRRRMAEGHGSLELAFFSLEILEAYRNDPKYNFEAHDFQVRFHIASEVYEDPETAEKDKVIAARVGFAYDKTTLKGPKLKRYVAVFLNDLGKLTPQHQRRWESFEQTDVQDIVPHPVWMDWMMGKWTDGLGPFAKILIELEAINELFLLIFGQKLFRHTDRPRDWGWMIRPSGAEWDLFVHVTDKLLSDNLRDKALKAAGVIDRDENGEKIGTLKRLWLFVQSHSRVPADEITRVLEPLFEVRRQRQRPAHRIAANVINDELLMRQVELLESIGEALEAIRFLLTSARQASSWQEPKRLNEHAFRM